MQIRDCRTVVTDELRQLFELHADVCQALGNPYRLAIMYALKEGEKCVSDVAATVGISVHNASQHLRVLRDRLLVRARKEGQTVYYSIANPKFVEACRLLREALAEEYGAERLKLTEVQSLDNTNLREGNTMSQDSGVDLALIQSNKVVDARGTSCPGPVLAAKKGMAEVKIGEVLEVLSTDSGTRKDLPAWASKMGHEFLGTIEEAGYTRYFVRKMK